MNIFFTLLVSLLAIWGLHTKKWWLFISMFLLANLINFDYSGNGIILMLIFYLCRNRPALGAGLYVLFWIPALWSGYMEDPKSLIIAGHAINWTILPCCQFFRFIFLPGQGLKFPNGFFTAFIRLI